MCVYGGEAAERRLISSRKRKSTALRADGLAPVADAPSGPGSVTEPLYVVVKSLVSVSRHRRRFERFLTSE